MILKPVSKGVLSQLFAATDPKAAHLNGKVRILSCFSVLGSYCTSCVVSATMGPSRRAASKNQGRSRAAEDVGLLHGRYPTIPIKVELVFSGVY